MDLTDKLDGIHGIVLIHPDFTFDHKRTSYSPSLDTYLERLDEVTQYANSLKIPIAAIRTFDEKFHSLLDEVSRFWEIFHYNAFSSDPNPVLQYFSDQAGVEIVELDIALGGSIYQGCVENFNRRSFKIHEGPKIGYSLSEFNHANPKGYRGRNIQYLTRWRTDP